MSKNQRNESASAPSKDAPLRSKFYEPQADWKAGLTLRLNEKEQKLIKAEEEKNEMEILELLHMLGANGIKTSMSYDRIQNSYTVTITRNRLGFKDSGYSLSVRSKYLNRCFLALLYALEDPTDFNILEIDALRRAAVPEF